MQASWFDLIENVIPMDREVSLDMAYLDLYFEFRKGADNWMVK